MTKREILSRLGDISQIAGAKRYRLVGGKADGVEAVDVRTGGGLAFTVLPGRGMDIAWAEYRGESLCYMAKPGIVAAGMYEPETIGWLRGFFAGMLTTCGLSNVGWPCQDAHPVFKTMDHGLHGRIAFTPAEDVCVRQTWEPDFTIRVSGRMRQAILHGENLVLEREITTRFGQRSFILRDTIENQGFQPEPLMILYHFNFGHPLLSEHARLILPATSTEPVTEAAKQEPSTWASFAPPAAAYDERLYFHRPAAGTDGRVAIALIDDRRQLGAVLRYDPRQLPKLAQWKCLREAEYVLGIEPGNCHPTSRVEHRRLGELEHLQPGERKVVEIEFSVLEGAAEIQEFERAATRPV